MSHGTVFRIVQYAPGVGDAGPHPNKAHAAWGRRAHRLEPDPVTAPVVRWMFAQRLAGHSVARITRDLVDPASTGLGHKQVQRWNLPEGWVISKHPAHAALVSEADFIAVQAMTAHRGPAGPAARQYLLAGLLACGRCGRQLESAWSNGKPAYRCRHGHTSAARPDARRPKNAYLREAQILPHLAALAITIGQDR